MTNNCVPYKAENIAARSGANLSDAFADKRKKTRR